ncbi:MAG: trigger factor [Candidatus Omnitrophica bacterium]|nr:trigger factor [Candidatus Omnitrophota bacterium]
MKISVQDGKTCEKILKVEIGQEWIQKEFNAFYESVASKAKIPGFRPGKAPREVLVMHFQKDAREKVLENLVSDSYRQAVQEQGLEPLGYPEIKDVDFKEEKLSYKASIEVRPKIKLSKVTGLSAKREKAEVTDEDVAQSLQRVQAAFAQQKTVEGRPAQMGDVVVADYVCTVDGQEVEKRSDDWFELKEKEYLQGISAGLVGVQPQDEKEIQITLPPNFSRKEYADKPALFQMKVKEIKTRVLPELNDDLAKEAGDFKSLEALKTKIREDLFTMKDRQKEAEYERALLEELIKKNKVDLPEKLVQRRLERLIEDAEANTRRQGVPDEKLKELHEKFHQELEPEARRQVHLAFLLDEIAVRENVTVKEDDIKERMQRVAEQIRQPLEAVERYYQEHEDAKLSLVDQVRNEKAIEFVKNNAKK